MNFIDTHAHLFHEDFQNELPELVTRLEVADVKQVVLPNIDLSTVDMVHKLADAYPEMMLATMGLHPCHVFSEYENDLQVIEGLLVDRKYVAIGEAGLDYFHDLTFVEEQKKALEIQISWAKGLGIPIIIHCRNAFEDAISMMEAHQDGSLKGVFHCFTGTAEEAKRVTDSGFYLGIGGVITYPKAGLYEPAMFFGHDFVVLETDSPYLPPVPFRGKRNESSYLPYINSKLASAWRLKDEEVALITSNNAKRLFSIN
jgi:TatD DNase family protein